MFFYNELRVIYVTGIANQNPFACRVSRNMTSAWELQQILEDMFLELFQSLWLYSGDESGGISYIYNNWCYDSREAVICSPTETKKHSQALIRFRIFLCYYTRGDRWDNLKSKNYTKLWYTLRPGVISKKSAI